MSDVDDYWLGPDVAEMERTMSAFGSEDAESADADAESDGAESADAESDGAESEDADADAEDADADDQTRAVRLATRGGSRLVIVTGGPGTGKTWTARRIVEAWRRRGEHIVLVSPTGKAQTMLQRSVGDLARARTLDSFLYDMPAMVAARKGCCLLCDEASMVGLEAFSSLLDVVFAGSRTSRLVLLGDPDQLAPVRALPFLRALIDSKSTATVLLRRVHRQQAGAAGISRLLSLLREPRALSVDDMFRASSGVDVALVDDDATRGTVDPDDSFHFVSEARQDEIVKLVREARDAFMREQGPRGMTLMICCFTKALQSKLNDALQPAGTDPVPGCPAVRFGDVVRCAENYYEYGSSSAPKRARSKELRVPTGAIGVVRRFTGERPLPGIVYSTVDASGRPVTYTDYADERGFKTRFELAHATTVHSAQGDEADVVIGVLDVPATHPHEVRSLAYTLCSRARRQLFLIVPPGSEQVVFGYHPPPASYYKLRDLLRGIGDGAAS